MFCPKCGTQNPENGKFCRSCGTDLSPVSDALAGKSSNQTPGFGMMSPIQPIQLWDKKGKSVNWESAIVEIFVGLAFLIVAAVLGITGIAGGQFWWFWMLIPAFGSLGSGVAKYIQLKKSERQNASFAPPNAQNVISSAPPNAALPPNQTAYVAPDSRYKTGELVPPSVVENTTRHLEMNSEGETMNLPKK
ncbi:MAG: zinc-ribbon domain-containing protein [Pyrinomonadaceae bacterium]|nr:zinc-ribbon domain-containing protein [Pyrinomonadaceae bacterium]